MSGRATGSSVILIGMPGVGKSTLGQLLAATRQQAFVDTDELIVARAQQSLQSILDEQGYLGLRQQEECAILAQSFANQVVATGGSAVYSDKAMTHLQRFGVVVFLQDDVSALLARINNMESRGIAKAPDQSFEALCIEREALYRRYADVTLAVSGSDPAQLLQRLLPLLSPS